MTCCDESMRSSADASGRRRLSVLVVACLSMWAAPSVAQPAAVEAVRLVSGDTVRVAVPGVELEGGALHTIDVDGRLDLGRLGTVSVAGLAVPEAQVAVRAQLATLLRDASGVTLVLQERGVMVEVRGLVSRPGMHVLRGPSPDVWAALSAAGGAVADADLQRVTVRRAGGATPDVVEVLVDVRRWLVAADVANRGTSDLPAVQAGDSIFVPARAGFAGVQQGNEGDVLVVGAVMRPGYVPVSGPLDLWQVIGQAGGPSSTADLTAVRVVANGHSKAWDVAGALQHGTPIIVERGTSPVSIFVADRDGAEPRLSSTVSVMGGVVKPGRHPLGTLTPLLDVIALAGGVTADGDLHRVTLIRRHRGLVAHSVIDLTRNVGRAATDMVVEPGDTIMVAFVSDDPVRVAIKVIADVALIAGILGVVVGLVGGVQ